VGVVAAGPAVVLAGQLRSPLHTLGQELTALLTAVVALTVFFAGAARAARTARLRGSLRATLAAAGAAALSALALLALVNALGPRCDLARGLAVFVTTYVPAVIFAAVLGVAIGQARPRPWQLGAVMASLVLVSAAHDAAQLALGASAVPIDVLLGELQLGQRASPEVSAVHLRQRVLLLLLAASVWSLAVWRARRGRDRRRARRAGAGALVAGGLLVALAALGGSRAGVGWGWERVLDRLDVTRAREHLVLHLEDDPRVWSNLDALVREAEWERHDLGRTLGIEGGEPVHVFVYADREALTALTGVPAQHAGLRQVHLLPQAWRGETLRHELVHALHIDLDPSPWIVLSRGMLEGTAVAIESGAHRLPEAHALQAAALAAGSLPRARSIFQLAGFVEHSEQAAYEAAGSFLGWLFIEHGPERFLELQRRLDFEAVYGRDLDALDAGWREFLAGVPTSGDARQEGARLFDRALHPPFRALDCPKLGLARLGQADLARRHVAAGEHAEAHRLFRGLWAREGRAAWAVAAARSLAETGRAPEPPRDAPPGDPRPLREALELLRAAADADGVRDHERAELLDEEIRLLAWLRDWPALERTFEQRRASGLVPATRARMIEACLRDPALREGTATALLGDPRHARSRWARLLAERPASTPLLYLHAAAAAPGQPIDERAAELTAVARSCPDCGDLVGGELVELLDVAFAERAWDEIETIAAIVRERSTSALHHHQASRAVERLAWERARGQRESAVLSGAAERSGDGRS
jgi:hypothetical protein